MKLLLHFYFYLNNANNWEHNFLSTVPVPVPPPVVPPPVRSPPVAAVATGSVVVNDDDGRVGTEAGTTARNNNGQRLRPEKAIDFCTYKYCIL